MRASAMHHVGVSCDDAGLPSSRRRFVAQNVPPKGLGSPLCALPCVIGYDCVYQSIYLGLCNQPGAMFDWNGPLD